MCTIVPGQELLLDMLSIDAQYPSGDIGEAARYMKPKTQEKSVIGRNIPLLNPQDSLEREKDQVLNQ